MDGAHLSSNGAHTPLGAARCHTEGMLRCERHYVQDKDSPTSRSHGAKQDSENEELIIDT
jgi:hypothetical protein